MTDPSTSGSRTPGAARTALVTGANRGIGRELALGLAGSGIAVGLLGRAGPGLELVAEEIRAAGGTAVVAVADVRRLAEVDAVVADVQDAIGGLDLLVNSAGVIESQEGPVWTADPGEWWDVVETDLRGPFHLIRAVVPGMLERGGGRVINLNSGSGTHDRAVYSAYAAAKTGLFRLTGNLHLAGFADGLRAFELAPGTVRTAMTAGMPMHADRTAWTPPQAVVELAIGFARGELDAWSGCFVRAGVDTVESLRKVAAELGDPGEVPTPARRLVVAPWGPGDPLS
jgi:NAD(P)-dependent dehydrogenase (short-subunit alcohol dehydrogenase family)